MLDPNSALAPFESNASLGARLQPDRVEIDDPQDAVRPQEPLPRQFGRAGAIETDLAERHAQG